LVTVIIANALIASFFVMVAYGITTFFHKERNIWNYVLPLCGLPSPPILS
jgi:hypothetical protein